MRKVDYELVKNVIEKVEGEYKEKMGREVKVMIDEENEVVEGR